MSLSDESRAPLSAKIQGGHDNDLIEIEPSITLPNSLQREFPLLSGQTAKPGQQPVLHRLKEFIGDQPADKIAIPSCIPPEADRAGIVRPPSEYTGKLNDLAPVSCWFAL